MREKDPPEIDELARRAEEGKFGGPAHPCNVAMKSRAAR